MTYHICAYVGLVLATSALACPPEVFVDASAPSGGDGSSWSTAFNDLQAAVTCPEARLIHVAEGTYLPGDSRDDVFSLNDDVQVLGGYPPGGGERNPSVHETVLSGLVGQNHSVLVSIVNRPKGVTLDGLTLTGVDDVGDGSAVKIRDSTVLLRQCRVMDNLTSEGGGVLAEDSDLTIIACHFEGNTAYDDCLAVGGAVSARVRMQPGRTRIIASAFVGNDAIAQGCSGGFDGRAFGGALSLQSDSNLILNCRFEGNSAEGEVTGIGGAVRTGGTTTLANCVFADNSASGRQMRAEGGALRMAFGEVANSTLVGNVASGQGGTIEVVQGGQVKVANVIVRDSSGSSVIGNAIVRYSNITGGYPGQGNIDVDPMLDPDYRLLPGSPCIDAAWSNVVPGWLWGDLDFNPRKVDDPATPDTGRGRPPIDMGAFEFQP